MSFPPSVLPSPSTPPRGSSLAGKAYWAMVQRVALTAACIDLGYIGLFLWLGSRPLALVNLASIALYLGAYALIQRRRNVAALLLIWTEVISHSALGSLLIGWDSGFHYYLLLFIPAIVIANAGRYAAPIVLALLSYYMGLRVLCDYTGPLDPLPGNGMQLVNWIHICIAFALSAALAAYYRRTILIAERRLLKLATLDGLTGLFNRSHFQEQASATLEKCARQGAPVALWLCDVDHFKRVNDTHGHAVGDKVLQAVARTMAGHLREDDLLARWGGEEFLALLPYTDTATARQVAERIRQAVQDSSLDLGDLSEGEQPLRVTLSFGVTLVQDAQDLKAATARADQALYASKRAGRNCVSVG
ncbi:GGDEF domain-containing protein [Acidovorax sp. DW039]|uniref:GGDEF domain-containing protein n=1 Tax=Acidovorax sp. DW039 TaxID=3095606 RepID=UPI00308917A2|nr:GGDEF domain-containing protein [Acidovorax sp. DW039]